MVKMPTVNNTKSDKIIFNQHDLKRSILNKYDIVQLHKAKFMHENVTCRLRSYKSTILYCHTVKHTQRFNLIHVQSFICRTHWPMQCERML